MKRPAKDTTTVLGLYVGETRDGDFYHIEAHPVTIGPTLDDRRALDSYDRPLPSSEAIRNFGSASFNGMRLSDLRISSQGNNIDADRRLYGFDVVYRDSYAVDLHAAEEMVKTLRRIDRRLAALNAKYGTPATFGAYLGRVADAIGATRFVFKRGTARGWSYSDNEHRIAEVGDGIRIVDFMATTWANENKPKCDEVVSS